MTLRLLQDIQGMQVVSLAEGRTLGLVQKVFLNPAQKSVCGLLVRQAKLAWFGVYCAIAGLAGLWLTR